MKKILTLLILMSASAWATADNIKRENLIIEFASKNCQDECSVFHNQIKKYGNKDVNTVFFDSQHFEDLYAEILAKNKTQFRESTTYFLNEKRMPMSFVRHLNTRDFKTPIVGYLKHEYDNETNSFHIYYDSYKASHKDTIVGRFKKKFGIPQKQKNYDYDGQNLTLKYAITNPIRSEYQTEGTNEGNHFNLNNYVIEYGEIQSSGYSWVINVDRSAEKYDFDSLSLVVWLLDEDGEFITSKKMKFYREVYK